MFEQVLSFLRHCATPAHCVSCLALLDTHEEMPFCPSCESNIQPVVSVEIPVTTSWELSVHACGAYDDPLCALILSKQYGLVSGAHQLGALMARRMGHLITPEDILVPIPLHWRRFAWRGYNQAERMAHVIAQTTGAQVIPVVRRTGHTPQQMMRHARDRWSNVAHVFEWNPKYDHSVIAGKRIIIIDDLMTTGSTLRAVARVVHAAKPTQIQAFVAARVL